MSDTYQSAPDVVDTTLQQEMREKLYAAGAARGINPARKERIHENIRFDDLVAELTGRHGSKISCPFHGRDSNPSFTFYRGPNNAFCFGCPPNKGFYDHIRFVQEYYGVSWVEALVWIEKHFGFPPMEDVLLEQEEMDDQQEEEIIKLTFHDLSEPYLAKVAREVRKIKDPDYAQECLLIYFQALAHETSAEQAQTSDAVEATRLHDHATTLLARFLGQQQVSSILSLKEELR